MIIPMDFYVGNPPEGTAASGDTAKVVVFDLGIQVPAWRKWRIASYTVSNLTQITGFYSIGVFQDPVPSQVDMGALDTSALPRSIAGGPGAKVYGTSPFTPVGFYVAWSQPIPKTTIWTIPVVKYALGGMHLMVGAYPGQNDLLGAGGISMSISGWELS